MSVEKISALILAAGQSSRMGALKPKLEIEHKAAILWVIEAFQKAGVKDIRVIVGYHSNEVRQILVHKHVQIVENMAPERGMFSSVKVGVASLESNVEGFFLIPADIPMIRHQTIEKILKAHKANPDKIIFPSFLGQRGHPPFIHRNCFKTILESDENMNLRRVLDIFKANWIELPCADNGILMDMDTPADYEKILTYSAMRSIPNLDECQALLNLFQVSSRVRRHSQAVSVLACRIARDLNDKEGPFISEQILKKAGLLHDVGRGQPNHAFLGAKMISEEGFYGLEEIISCHMDIELPPNGLKITEKELLYLSDKLTEEDQYISLETRFENTRKKYPKVDGNIIFLRFYNAKRIKDKIESILMIENLYDFFHEKSLEVINNECKKNLF
ncbi:DVU_1551 family NTP transferase [Fusibacter ferrireducens]|uniref:NTP transferase domain-containing protein n=1 Tax=Fusibacter ferrireducens TaxID=2785058 RepID=A0ABR9ZUA6_9FIRM|nr:NTP transferase domain-containing protein [Fusibacter ferrireducens]MBF4694059.1 NTP transferase domain-containing protein [Fusibacter ferrireducens]